MNEVTWDYSELAAHYDKRADYADAAIDAVIALAKPSVNRPLADIGAGTAKLTRPLLARGFTVHAVEPNDEMREVGRKNTEGQAVTWSVGTGEATGLEDAAYDLVTFGSSFNVTDRAATLTECARILRPRGWFCCMWNHRDLDDETQKLCEDTIRKHVPGYGYGSRREDQTAIIAASGLFEPAVSCEHPTVNTISHEDFVEAWRSHATLQRQAGDAFQAIVEEISAALADRTSIDVPYMTRVYCARLQ